MQDMWRIVLLIIQGIIVFLIMNIPKHKGTLYMGLSSGILAYYSLFPLLVNIMYVSSDANTKKQILSQYFTAGIVKADILEMLIVHLLVCVFTLLFVWSYSSKKEIVIKGIVTELGTKNRKLLPERELKRNFISKLNVVGDVFLIVGGISILYYTLSFGSISRALALAGWIRSGTPSTEYISYIASIMIIPGGLTVLATFCYLLSADYTKSIWRKLKLIVSFALSILFLLIRAGRAPLILFILAFCMPIAKKMFKHPWVVLCICAIIGSPILSYLNYIIDGGEFVFQYDIIGTISEFAYPYNTAMKCFEIVGENGIRWGKDFITSLLSVLPGLSFDTTWQVVTEYYGRDAIIPTDLITLCVFQFHIIGVVLGCLLGRVVRCVDFACDAYLHNKQMYSNYGALSLTSYITLMGFWYVSTADLDSIVRCMYYMGMCVIVVITTKRKIRVRGNP